ncbi:hypothetical protein [Variovorax sp.]|uniref:hypothetical protein n=1 Tax=Variovorax sp. TaxID=1871043 RepID=UPI003BAA405A
MFPPESISRRPMPVHVPDWQLVPKEGEPVEGALFRAPLPRAEREALARDRALNDLKGTAGYGSLSLAHELAQQNRGAA